VYRKRICMIMLALLVSALVMDLTCQATCAQVETELVVIAPSPTAILDKMAAEYKKWMSAKLGVTVKVEIKGGMGTEECLKRLEEEGGKPYEDVWFSGRVPDYMYADTKGLLQAYKGGKVVDWWKDLPEKVFGVPAKDPEGKWSSFSVTGVGFLYNRDFMAKYGLPMPVSWKDIGNPVYKGRVGTGDPATSAIVHLVLEAVLQSHGWEKGWEIWLSIARNTDFAAGASGSAVKCSKGETAISLNKDSNGFTEIAKGYNIAWVYPEEGTPLVPLAMGLLKGCRHPEAGKAFVDWVMSGEGMALWCNERYENPIRPDVPIPKGVADLKKAKIMPNFDLDLQAIRTASLNLLHTEKVIGNQKALEKASDSEISQFAQDWFVRPMNEAKAAIASAEARIKETRAKIADPFGPKMTKEGESKMVDAEKGLADAKKSFAEYSFEEAKRKANDAMALADRALGASEPSTLPTYIAIGLGIVVIAAIAVYQRRRKR